VQKHCLLQISLFLSLRIPSSSSCGLRSCWASHGRVPANHLWNSPCRAKLC